MKSFVFFAAKPPRRLDNWIARPGVYTKRLRYLFERLEVEVVDLSENLLENVNYNTIVRSHIKSSVLGPAFTEKITQGREEVKSELIQAAEKNPDTKILVLDDPFTNQLIQHEAQRLGLKVVGVVASLHALSHKLEVDSNRILFEREVEVLKKCELVVCFTEEEAWFLKSLGVDVVCLSVNCFKGHSKAVDERSSIQPVVEKSVLDFYCDSRTKLTKEHMSFWVEVCKTKNLKVFGLSKLSVDRLFDRLEVKQPSNLIVADGKLSQADLATSISQAEFAICDQLENKDLLLLLPELQAAGLPVCVREGCFPTYSMRRGVRGFKSRKELLDIILDPSPELPDAQLRVDFRALRLGLQELREGFDHEKLREPSVEVRVCFLVGQPSFKDSFCRTLSAHSDVEVCEGTELLSALATNQSILPELLAPFLSDEGRKRLERKIASNRMTAHKIFDWVVTQLTQYANQKKKKVLVFSGYKPASCLSSLPSENQSVAYLHLQNQILTEYLSFSQEKEVGEVSVVEFCKRWQEHGSYSLDFFREKNHFVLLEENLLKDNYYELSKVCRFLGICREKGGSLGYKKNVAAAEQSERIPPEVLSFLKVEGSAVDNVYNAFERLQWPIVQGEVLFKFRDAFSANVKHDAQLGHAGLVKNGSGYTALFKNSVFGFPKEMGYRVVPKGTVPYGQNCLYRVDFDKDFNPTCFKEVSVHYSSANQQEVFEDTRLFNVGDRVYAVGARIFRDMPSAQVKAMLPPRTQMVYGELVGDQLSANEISWQLFQPQKNWAAFEKDNDIHFICHVHPLVVRSELDGKVKDWISEYTYPDFGGVLRGGTPPVKLDTGEYLAVAHYTKHRSEIGASVRAGLKDLVMDYSVVFYTFEGESPFRMMRVSQPVKLVSPDRIQFPMGLVLKGKELLVSFGVNDCDCYIARFDLEDVKSLLQNAEVEK